MRKNIILTLALLIFGITAQAAKVETRHIDTRLVAGGMDITVITPDHATRGIKCPTVYLLNGYDGNHKQWLSTQPLLPSLADQYGFIFVLPAGHDSWYWDAPANPEMQMESHIITELVPYIDANYPTIPDPAKRAITGLSMGGHGAMWLALRHPDVFGNVGSTSGGLDITPFPGKWKTAAALGKADPAKYTAISQIPNIRPGQLNIIFDCGNDDFFATVNRNFHDALNAAGIPHDYIQRPGAHTHQYWANAILFQLLFFNEAFSK